jgi:hypothetical protein
LDSIPLSASCIATETIANVRERLGGVFDGVFGLVTSSVWTIQSTITLLLTWPRPRSSWPRVPSDASAPHPVSTPPASRQAARSDKLPSISTRPR